MSALKNEDFKQLLAEYEEFKAKADKYDELEVKYNELNVRYLSIKDKLKVYLDQVVQKVRETYPDEVEKQKALYDEINAATLELNKENDVAMNDALKSIKKCQTQLENAIAKLEELQNNSQREFISLDEKVERDIQQDTNALLDFVQRDYDNMQNRVNEQTLKEQETKEAEQAAKEKALEDREKALSEKEAKYQETVNQFKEEFDAVQKRIAEERKQMQSDMDRERRAMQSSFDKKLAEIVKKETLRADNAIREAEEKAQKAIKEAEAMKAGLSLAKPEKAEQQIPTPAKTIETSVEEIEEDIFADETNEYTEKETPVAEEKVVETPVIKEDDPFAEEIPAEEYHTHKVDLKKEVPETENVLEIEEDPFAEEENVEKPTLTTPEKSFETPVSNPVHEEPEEEMELDDEDDYEEEVEEEEKEVQQSPKPPVHSNQQKLRDTKVEHPTIGNTPRGWFWYQNDGKKHAPQHGDER